MPSTRRYRVHKKSPYKWCLDKIFEFAVKAAVNMQSAKCTIAVCSKSVSRDSSPIIAAALSSLFAVGSQPCGSSLDCRTVRQKLYLTLDVNNTELLCLSG